MRGHLFLLIGDLNIGKAGIKKMGKTIRNTEGKWLRTPKGNRGRKNNLRPKAVPPTDWDDLDVAGYSEDWGLTHEEVSDSNRDFNKKKKSLKREAKRLNRKESFLNED